MHSRLVRRISTRSRLAGWLARAEGVVERPPGGERCGECHTAIYRLAKAAGQLERLERRPIASAPEPRGGSPWLEHFSGRAPHRRRRQGS